MKGLPEEAGLDFSKARNAVRTSQKVGTTQRLRVRNTNDIFKRARDTTASPNQA